MESTQPLNQIHTQNASPLPENETWQSILRTASVSLEELLRELDLDDKNIPISLKANQQFSLRAPQPYRQRIEKGNPDDPLLKQILPIQDEMLQAPGYSTDPLQEMEANPIPGLIHKYKSRVLLVTTGACAINCRYCFRRHFPYEDNKTSGAQWLQILNYLRQDVHINEVIFSGGDPLTTPDKRLTKMIGDLEKIEHIQRVRIHSRLPVVIPQRVTPAFISLLEETRLDAVLVMHINHPNEIDADLIAAIKRLRQAGVHLLNQAVLLRSVNDDVSTLTQLSESLFSAGVLPYYLFTLDPVQGATHFNVPDNEAIELFKSLQAELPGYLVPKLAREIPDKPSKTLLGL